MIPWILFLCAPVAAHPIRNVELHSDRNFGYVIGDLVYHTVTVSVEKPYSLDLAFLPNQGPLTPWLEIAAIQISESPVEHTTRYEIQLRYQLYRSVRTTEEIEIPGFALRARAGAGEKIASATTPSWKLSVVPLIPEHITDEDVVIRAPQQPALLPLEIHYRIMRLLVTGVIVISLLLFIRPGFLGFAVKRKNAFAEASRFLRARRNAPTESKAYREAVRAVHRAFNQTAGKTVFASQLDHFFLENPQFGLYRPETELFFLISRQIFFGQSAGIQCTDFPVRWLESLCRKYRKIERIGS